MTTEETVSYCQQALISLKVDQEEQLEVLSHLLVQYDIYSM